VSFSQTTVTHVFEGADGSAASGSVTFTLTERMTQSGITILPAEITANLDASGHISQALTSNQDPGTIPQNAQWRVDWRISSATGSPVTESFFITVPPGPGTVDLGSLLPQQPIGG
jgi:hypothetical protein